jgi:hypothetical protein
MRLFGKKKEAPKEVPCTCSLCSLLNSLEPKLKNKPYEKSLLKFIIGPIGMDRSMKEIEEEAKKFEKTGNIEGARASYHMLVGAALAKEKVPAKDVKRYMNEYMKFLKKRKLSSSDYFPTMEDCLKIMKNLDEILGIVRGVYPKSPKA